MRSGLGFVQVLRPALYALLVSSAFFTFLAGGDIAGRTLPHWTQRVAPTLFAIFLVVFTFYRLALVRAKKYPAGAGFFQVGLGALIWVLLLPATRQRIEGPRDADAVPALLSSADARVRALAAEVAGLRPQPERYAAALLDRLDDSDARVRAQARSSLRRIAGTDPAPGLGDEASAPRWRALARQRGWLRPGP